MLGRGGCVGSAWAHALVALVGVCGVLGVLAAPASADGWLANHSESDRQAIVDYMYKRAGRADVPYGGAPAQRAQEMSDQTSALASNPSAAAQRLADEELRAGQQAGLIPPSHVLAPILSPTAGNQGRFESGFAIGDSGHILYGKLAVTVGLPGGSPFSWSYLTWRDKGYPIYEGATVQQDPGAYLFADSGGFGVARWFDDPCPFSGFHWPTGASLQSGLPTSAKCLVPSHIPYVPPSLADILVDYPYIAENVPRSQQPLRPYDPRDGSFPTPPPPTVTVGGVEGALGPIFDGPDAGTLRPFIDNGLGVDGVKNPVTDPPPIPGGPQKPELNGPGRSPASPNLPRCLGGDPVDCATGNFSETQDDLVVGGLGELDLARTYNAQAAADATDRGRFGYGWADHYGQHLVIDAANDQVSVVGAQGEAVVFYANGDGSFQHAPWVQATLRRNDDGSYDYGLPDRSSSRFDAAGRLVAQRARDGNATTLHYDSDGNVADATAPGGRAISFAYNADGTVASATSSAGREVHYGYESGTLTSVTNARGGVWHFTYDGQHRLTHAEDPRGGHVDNTYDTQSRVTAQTDRRGHQTTWSYDGDVTTMTDPEGSVREMTFANNLPTRIVSAKGTADEATKLIAYDAASNPVTVTDGRGHQWRYGYDDAGNRTSATDPLGMTTSWTYDSDRDVLSQTLPSGRTTSYVYDGHGNPTTITRTLSTTQTETTTLDYDAQGQLHTRTDPLGHAWSYEHNSHGDLTSATSPLGHKTSYEHDADGLVTATVAPRGHLAGADPADFTTTYQRNEAGQPTVVTDPLGHDTLVDYDANGNQISVTDPDGRQTQTTYDADDQPTATERGDGSTLHTGYDDNGRVISQTDAAGHQTTYQRDAQGRVASVTDARGRTSSYGYDKADNRTTVTDTDQRTTTYSYDDANKLTDVNYSTGAPAHVAMTYTTDGQLAEMTDASGVSTWNYDKLGRLVSQSGGQGQFVGYHFDLAGRVTSIDYPDALAPGPPNSSPSHVTTGTVTRTYDDDGRLTAVTDWLNHETTFDYNADDALTAIQRPDETTATRSVDRADQLNAISDTGPHYGYTADYTRTDAGLLASATETGDGAGADATYTHDDASRLTASGAGNDAYAYDAADNPTQLTDAAQTRKQTFDAANQLTAITDAADDPIAELDYDAEGDRTSLTPTTGPATTYSYDQARQLTRYQGPDASGSATIDQTYGYDGTGLRQYTQAGGTRTYETWQRSGSLPLMIEDGATSYIYGPDTTPIEQITAAGQVRYYHHDQLGSTRALTDQDGQLVATYSYTPYGTLKAATGSATNPFGYAGQYTDPTGLQYLRARYYDPTTAQFLTRDPVEAETRHAYGYADANPTDLTDPTGLISFGDVGGWLVDHSGTVIGGATFAGCIVVSAGVCAGGVLVGTVVNGVIIGVTKPRNEVWGDEALNAVGGLIGGVVPSGLAKAGEGAIPRFLKPAINYVTGLPSGIYGLLDPHPDACGGLSSSLGPST